MSKRALHKWVTVGVTVGAAVAALVLGVLYDEATLIGAGVLGLMLPASNPWRFGGLK